MDVIRECYYSNMRLYPQHPEILTPGRWRWCPEGAIALPFEHRFGSFSGDNWTEIVDPPIGEVKRWNGFSAGRSSPRYTGQNYCGAVALWQQGSPLSLQGTPATDAEGVPVCCKTTGPELGGLVANGSGIGGSWTDLALWLRPEELKGLSEGEAFTTWPAAPTTPRDGTPNVETPITYHVDPFCGQGGGYFATRLPTVFDQTIIHFDPLVLGDWSIYTVGRTTVGGVHGPSVGNNLDGSNALEVANDFVFNTYLGTPVVSTTSGVPALGDLHYWGTRRTGNLWEIILDGMVLASAVGPTGAVPINYWFGFYGIGPGGFCWMPEIMGFARALSPAEDAAIWSYLMAKYGVPDMPVTGSLLTMPLATPIAGYLLCDGSAHHIADYPDLSAYLAGHYDTYRGAAAPAVGQFRVPDLRGLVLVGGGSAGINPTTSAYTLAETGGEEEHTLNTAEMPTHSHTVDDPGHEHQSETGADFFLSAAGALVVSSPGPDFGMSGTNTALQFTGISLENTGDSIAHNNIQPFGVGFVFIKT